MRLAIEVMLSSVPELRSDGKVPPKVGAVLIDPNHEPKVTTAARGELREGDHAEFTLLERKCRSRNVTKCILFATLEPCAPNSRKAPKLGCAERIVNARIKQVWVGIEDPDPTVDRKGIKYLQDNGIEVHMFDREFQEQIRNENKDFIAQALDRAADEEKKQPEVSLSEFESASKHTKVSDLEPKALNEYKTRAGLPEKVGSNDFSRRLLRQGLLKEEKNTRTPTGFGLLLFGKEPRSAMPQAGLLATIHYPDGSEEVRDFDGPQVLVPELALAWLRDKLPNVIDRSKGKRADKNEALFELVREGIVNALVHRDYSEEGAKCQLIVTKDKIEILSPGLPVAPITLEQMQSFSAPMLSRNPVLHYVFAKMELAEERGLGLKSMKESAEAAKLPAPRYAWNDPYLVLTLLPSSEASTAVLPRDIVSNLNEKEIEGWEWLSLRGRAKAAEYAAAMDVDNRTARRHLNRFVELGLTRKIGAARSTYYEIAQYQDTN